MANTAIITKQSVEKLNDDDYRISIHVVIKDDLDVILVEKDYSERYYSALSIRVIKTKLQAQIASDWDLHVAEQDKFDAPAFDTMVSEIESAANTYINS